jgi:hypothetical protein
MSDSMQALKEKIQSNLSSVIVIFLGVVLILGGIIYSLSHRHRPIEFTPRGDCNTKTETYVVESGSTDLFPVGSQIQVEVGYYNCHPGERDQVVMLKVPGRDTPLIESIRMVPGDTYEVRAEKNRRYSVHVNGDTLENSKGVEYNYDQNRISMIKLYENTFKKGIKKDVYFTFFEDPTGGFDATRMGPVTPEVMLGKVVSQVAQAKAPAAEPVAAKEDKSKEEKPVVKKEEHKKTVSGPVPPPPPKPSSAPAPIAPKGKAKATRAKK